MMRSNIRVWDSVRHAQAIGLARRIFSAAKPRSRHRALSKCRVFYELGVLRRLQASIQFV